METVRTDSWLCGGMHTTRTELNGRQSMKKFKGLHSPIHFSFTNVPQKLKRTNKRYYRCEMLMCTNVTRIRTFNIQKTLHNLYVQYV